MTARNDLESAFSILDAGITAHVAALKTAHAAVADESYLNGLTAKVIAFADTLNASNQVVVAPVVPAAVIATPVVAPAPSVAAAVASIAPVLTPAAQVAAQVAQVLPVAPVTAPAVATVAPAPVPVAPAALPATAAVFPDGKVPSVLETMEAAVKAMLAHK